MTRKRWRRSSTMTGGLGPAGVIGVQGGSGGVGASVLAAALAARAAASGRPTLCVDVDPWGCGGEVLLGAEGRPGLRWPDLELLAGEPDIPALLAELPGVGQLRTLGWGRQLHRSGPPRPWQVMAELAAAMALTVVDLGRPGPASPRWWLACDTVLVVAGTGVDQTVTAAAGVDLIPRVGGVVLRSRRTAVDESAISEALGVRVLAQLPDDPSVPAALARGVSVAAARTRLAGVADQLLQMLEREAVEAS